MNRKLLLTLTLAALATLVVGGAGCNPGQALCEKTRECAADPPGEDFLRICTTRYDGDIRAWRANKEPECHELADAKLQYDACIAQLDCRDFRESDHNGECDAERDAYRDLIEDTDGTLECTSAD